MAHVFISYSTKNADYARKLAEKLRASGFDIWIDNARLRSSDNWWESIVYALKDCSAFVVIMTRESRESRWVQREATLADNWGKPTFPLLLSGENWEMYVLTQYRDVRSGILPPQQFIDKLAEVAPRGAKEGRIVTPKHSSSRTQVSVPDADVRAAIANAPVPRDDQKRTKPRAQPQGCLLTALFGGLLGWLLRWSVRLALMGAVLLGVAWIGLDGDIEQVLDELYDGVSSLFDESYHVEPYDPDDPAPADAGTQNIGGNLGDYLQQGSIALQAGDPDEALWAYEQALEIAPESSDAKYGMGVAYHMMYDLDNAIYSYEEALNYGYEPQEELVYMLAQLYAAVGNLEAALEYAAWTTSLDEWNLDAWWMAATLASDLTYYEDAAFFYTQYVEHDGMRRMDFEEWLWERGYPVP